MPLEPNKYNGGRWRGFASDHAVKRAMNDIDGEVIEVPALSMTYWVSYRWLVLVRAGAAGGDVFNIEVAWQYDNDIALRLDVQEIRSLAANTRG